MGNAHVVSMRVFSEASMSDLRALDDHNSYQRHVKDTDGLTLAPSSHARCSDQAHLYFRIQRHDRREGRVLVDIIVGHRGSRSLSAGPQSGIRCKPPATADCR